MQFDRLLCKAKMVQKQLQLLYYTVCICNNRTIEGPSKLGNYSLRMVEKHYSSDVIFYLFKVVQSNGIRYVYGIGTLKVASNTYNRQASYILNSNGSVASIETSRILQFDCGSEQ